MAKPRRSSVLGRLKGKRIVFGGEFLGSGGAATHQASAEAHQATVVDKLDAKVDYLVLGDSRPSKPLPSQALALNRKGAAIQVIEVPEFLKQTEPTGADILALMRAGENEMFDAVVHSAIRQHRRKRTLIATLRSEILKGVALQNWQFLCIHFDACNFAGAKLQRVDFESVNGCDFSKATGLGNTFRSAKDGHFVKASLESATFQGDFSGADFTGAILEKARFNGDTDEQSLWVVGPTTSLCANVSFSKSKLKSALFCNLQFKSPDFSGADLTNAEFHACTVQSAKFNSATLRSALLIGCNLAGADFTNADLTGANLGGADLSNAQFRGANLKNANLRGAQLKGVDLSKAKNYRAGGPPAGSLGSALKELDTLNKKARQIEAVFRLSANGNRDGAEVKINGSYLKSGGRPKLPDHFGLGHWSSGGQTSNFSGVLLQLAAALGDCQVRLETIDVSSTKAAKSGKALRDLVVRGIMEAFAQKTPEEELAAAAKTHRVEKRIQGAALRKQAQAVAAKRRNTVNQRIAKKIKSTVGQVTDIASFLKALEVRIEKPKIDKATKMLKASGFKLFNDVTDEHVSGVVKSQTDADLVYACRVDHAGHYSCCTQNLNVCGGLRGSICKHLLVLIIGLVQAGELDPTTIDAWIAKTHSAKPELDKENMGAIFIKYKGAEAGEVDWRPTETVPEDYYAL